MTAITEPARTPIGELVRYFLRLGFLGFGGPVVLVGQMERELVDGKKWLTKEQMREAIAICQSLPGPLAIQVGVRPGLALMARFHDHVHLVPQGIEQVHQDIEEPLGRNRGREHRHLIARLGIAINVPAISFTRNHFQAERRTNRIGQREVPVSSYAEMSVELILAEVVEAGSRHTARVGTQHPLEEA